MEYKKTNRQIRVRVTAAACRTFRTLRANDLIGTLVNKHLSGDWGKYGKYAEIAPIISTNSSLDWSIGKSNVQALATNKGEVVSEYLLADILAPRKRFLWIKSVCVCTYLGARTHVVISLPGESKKYDYDEDQEEYSHIDYATFYDDYYREEFREEWEEYVNDWDASDWDERMKLVERDSDE